MVFVGILALVVPVVGVGTQIPVVTAKKFETALVSQVECLVGEESWLLEAILLSLMACLYRSLAAMRRYYLTAGQMEQDVDASPIVDVQYELAVGDLELALHFALKA